ncbi:hypothetical protein BJY16_005955 [Actinoplanes octamycinicus]|uniref:Lipoprotein n=1 Tax=Actinoplanes octamycinicus TaxID=135948 RepID=A0A7W7H1Y4_9ACTN|nr:hypothetical protein [Actinoplanes octamycinicus]MBB4742496.1 hypothetical protein [Actinoplanes octamycinicus]
MHDQLRRFTAGTVLLAGVLTLAGCTSGTTTSDQAGQPAPMVSSALPADPAAALAQAATRLGTESARFTMIFGKGEKSEQKTSGTVDSATGDWELIGSAYVVRRIGDDLYVKLTAEPELSNYAGQYADDLGKWVHQAAPAEGGSALALGKDFPWTPARAASGMIAPARTADRIYQGTVSAEAQAADPATSGGPAAAGSPAPSAEPAGSAGPAAAGTPGASAEPARSAGPATAGSPAASAEPAGSAGPATAGSPAPSGSPGAAAESMKAAEPVCTAELDIAGRFSRISTAADAKAPSMVLTFTDYGVPVQIATPPADQIVEDHLFTFAHLSAIFA